MPTSIAVVLAALVLAGCGGTDDAADVTVDTAAVARQAEELRAEAEAVLADLEREARGLGDARSSAEVEDGLDAMEERVDDAQARLGELELEGDEEEARDVLVTALERLEEDLDRLAEAVRDGDVRAILQRARDVSVREVRDAVEQVRAATDDAA